MKARENFLIFAAFTFTLLFIILCVVTLTGNDSDQYVDEPIHRLNSDSGTTGPHRNIMHSSTNNPDNTTQTLETKRTAPAANKHPANPRTKNRPSNFREIHQDNNSQLKAVESNGRVYLENTTGIEVCENNTNEEGKIEGIE
jgi:hypothetical protein